MTIGAVGAYDVPEQTIEAFATQLFNTWGIGERDHGDGVLPLTAANDREVRIEVGGGYGASNDGAMKRVIDDAIPPRFRAGEFTKGIAGGGPSSGGGASGSW